MSNLDVALSIALRAHSGQVDKAGSAYILHPLRVMMHMTTDEDRIVAVLHDVVEDSEITFDDLRRQGFSDAVIAAVDCLTRRVSDGESYEEFVTRLLPNDLARRVKRADLEDNMTATRLAALDDDALNRLQRYLRAWHRITDSSALWGVKTSIRRPSAHSGGGGRRESGSRRRTGQGGRCRR